jgi:hypothetical protein
VKVMMNSTSPSAMSADVCRSPVASVNSLAMVEASVAPDAKIESGEAVGVADHERYCHRFAQRAAKAQHHDADHAALDIGHDHRGDDLERGAAQAIGGPRAPAAAPSSAARAARRPYRGGS